MLLRDIVVSPTHKPREWILRKPIEYQGVYVRVGFRFDGASIPVGLRWLFPHGGKKFFAACLHDYLYRNQFGSREEADKMFYRAMIDNGVPKWEAITLYRGVRAGGWLSWERRKGN